MATVGPEVAADTELTGAGLPTTPVRLLCPPSGPRPSAFRAGQPQAFTFEPLVQAAEIQPPVSGFRKQYAPWADIPRRNVTGRAESP